MKHKSSIAVIISILVFCGLLITSCAQPPSEDSIKEAVKSYYETECNSIVTWGFTNFKGKITLLNIKIDGVTTEGKQGSVKLSISGKNIPSAELTAYQALMRTQNTRGNIVNLSFSDLNDTLEIKKYDRGWKVSSAPAIFRWDGGTVGNEFNIIRK